MVAVPEVPRMMPSPAAGVTWALTPANPLQVFGTSPKDHEEAIERVKKAKVRLLPAWAGRPTTVPCAGTQGWKGHREKPVMPTLSP